MLESLDPYTNYISESEIEGFRYITEGKYNGICAMIRKIGDYVTITEPYEDCPAHKAGLKAGDVIKAIDGKSAKNKDSDDIMSFLKGFPGTEVELTIQRPGESKDLKINMTRDEVRVPNVPYYSMVTDEVGYVSLTTFTRDAGKNVGNAIKELKEKNPSMKGLIFDLRGNGGGLLTEAVNVSNVFIPKGEVVVTTKGKVEDWDRSFKTLNKPVDQEIPLIILIDKGTASASEIVSGVIQDLDRGILLGQRSYGKGLVQATRDVGYNSKVKMTTSKYYIPSGRCIQGVSYKDGEPVDIPDNLRGKFTTRNGRTVLDGGGVKPDVALDKSSDANIIKSLHSEHMIFNYVTDYVLRNKDMGKIESFNFDKFDEFTAYIGKNNFDYKTDSEKAVEKLQKVAREEKLLKSIDSEIKALQAKINIEKKGDLDAFEEAIVNEIEKEIASRQYFQKGKVQVGLKNDKEIKEAVAILKDKKRYSDLLKK